VIREFCDSGVLASSHTWKQFEYPIFLSSRIKRQILQIYVKFGLFVLFIIASLIYHLIAHFMQVGNYEVFSLWILEVILYYLIR
jgi:hypothetical protein